MADAEQDCRRLVSNVDGLERTKVQFQAENERIVAENRALLEQLDGLNKAISEADSHVQSLTFMLEKATHEVRRLAVSANRVAELESQLDSLDTCNVSLHADLLAVKEDERSAVRRWQQAESTLRDLHDQVDRIEKEAREEAERHTRLIQRMEQRRSVELGISGAAVQLKGAATVAGSSTVGSFVHNILKDNTNLQTGIMELRELLATSNQEVENLREQVLYHHQPPLSEDGPPRERTLDEELIRTSGPGPSREVHIHHHYHTPAPKEKGPQMRRPKGRSPRVSLSSLYSPAPSMLGRKSSAHLARGSTSSTSTAGTSSLASSPQSAYRAPSIFDRIDRGLDSLPSSPEGNGLSSPLFDKPFRSSLCSTDELENGDVDAIPEEVEEIPNGNGNNDRDGLSTPLRKYSSIDSLFSVAGMDIHIPVVRHSQGNSRLLARSLRSTDHNNDAAESVLSTPAISTTMARATVLSRSDQSPRSLLASVAAVGIPETSLVGDRRTVSAKPSGTFGHRVGGWMRGRRAISSSNEVAPGDSSKPRNPISDADAHSHSSPHSHPHPFQFRPAGINQKGPIPGMRPPRPAPASVQPRLVDSDLLKESLAE